MSPQSLRELLTALSLAERAKALNFVSYMLTIYAREYSLAATDAESTSAAIKKLLGINELQHNLLSQAGHYLDGEEAKAYPLDVFSQTLFEKANHYDIMSVLNAALNYAERRGLTSQAH